MRCFEDNDKTLLTPSSFLQTSFYNRASETHSTLSVPFSFFLTFSLHLSEPLTLSSFSLPLLLANTRARTVCLPLGVKEINFQNGFSVITF